MFGLFLFMELNNKIICWWSGGVTSAIACKIAIDLYGKDNCRVIFLDTKNEDEDTYRFLIDCEKWYRLSIEIATNGKYNRIQEVWEKFGGLNFAHGAICSSELKRAVRLGFEKTNKFEHQVFGFDINESKRAKAIKINYPKSKPIFPLLFHALSKIDCIEMLEDSKIEIPRVYKYGYQNNNCFKTGCVQGGIGYWQKIQRDYPEKFNTMAKVEHDLTDIKGQPVTMLKDQSKKAKAEKNQLVFLKPHLSYPNVKDISMMKGREPLPLFECNGFCGSNDLEDRPQTELELNFDT